MKTKDFAVGIILFSGRYQLRIMFCSTQIVEVTQGWLKPVIDLMDSNPSIAAAQPKILAQRSKNKLNMPVLPAARSTSLDTPSAGAVFLTQSKKITVSITMCLRYSGLLAHACLCGLTAIMRWEGWMRISLPT